MNSYEVVTNPYADKVILLSMHIVVLHENQLTSLIREGLSFLMYTEASIMQFKSLAPVIDYTGYTRDYMSPKIIVQRS
jgi:hypothetical protein